MATRVTSTRFVGRAAEWRSFRRRSSERRRQPSFALVAGESGVGKSRLAYELADVARATGARVLSGDCVELGEGELPYAPLVGALRRVAREGDPAPSTLCPRPSGATSPRSCRHSAAARARRARRPSRSVCSGHSWRCSTDVRRAAAAARDRGPALGRQLDARVRPIPRPHALHRAHPGARHLPVRRAAPAAPAPPAAGRAGARPTGARCRARAAQPRRDGRAARGHPRQPRRPRAGRAALHAQRGQPAVHRGAAGRGASTGAARCRRRCATR